MNRDSASIAISVTKNDNEEVLTEVNIDIGVMQLNVGEQQNNQKPPEHQVNSDSQVNRDDASIAILVTKNDNEEVLTKVDRDIGKMQVKMGEQQSNEKAQEYKRAWS